MKKIPLVLMSILILISLFGCSKKNNDESTIEEKSNGNEVITFTSGLNINNNDAFDGQKREFNYNHLVGEFGGLEVYDEGNRTYCINFDGAANIKALVKNVSDRPLGFNLGEASTSGGILKYDAFGPEPIVHPNGAPNYMLEPGEEKVIQIDCSLFPGSAKEDYSESLILSVPFGVCEEDGYTQNYQLELEETVEYLTNDTLLSNKYLNAIVSGRILDDQGNPIANAEVEVESPFIELRNRVQTNENGEYLITVIGAKSSFSNAWRENALVVNKNGYNKRYIPIYPKSNQTVTADVTLYKQEYDYIYEEVTSVDVGLQAYEYDTNQEDIISFVPFHTGYDPIEVADYIKLTTTDFDGNVLYTYSLPNEIPFVDVSENGQYTVVSSNKIGGGFEIVILDRQGNEVYKTHDLKAVDKKYATSQDNLNMTISRCWQLSNDNKYLVVGDGNGDIWFIDWQNDKVLWSDYQCGQVRNIKFDKDSDAFYLSTGGGNLLCYDFDGNIKWKVDSQTWATKMEVTSKYVIVTLKCGGSNLSIYDKTNGNVVWNYPTMQCNMALAISPDEKYLWYGAHSSSSYSKIGSSIFDLDSGELIGMLNTQNCVGAQFSKDGSKIAVKRNGDVAVYDAKSGALLWDQRICDGDSVQNCSVAMNADGTKLAVSMNEVKEGNYGIVHFFNLKEMREANFEETPNDNQNDDGNGNETLNSGFTISTNIGDETLFFFGNDCGFHEASSNDSKVKETISEMDFRSRPLDQAFSEFLKICKEKGILDSMTELNISIYECDESNDEMTLARYYNDICSAFEVAVDNNGLKIRVNRLD